MKEKALKLGKKIAIDGIAMIGCIWAADLACSQIEFLSNAQSLLSVMAGIWLYSPLKKKLEDSKYLK